jgi:hypothetical protein
MSMSKGMIMMIVLALLGMAACEDNECSPCRDTVPPISMFKVEVSDWYIHALWAMPGPDQIYCHMTLTIENTSSKYSYSGVSIPSAKVYLSATNELLGEILFETDWDGVLDAGDIDTVVLDKIIEDSKLFEDPCNEDVYLELRIIATDHGEMQVRTPTDDFTCLI